ncbi:MAG: RnfABCDGE type electron transport complex subunit D [Clostridiales bacterium]|nr:RnfABCDGE type electron transport complex subunit D [Clostridiales bacterium]
MNEQLYNVSANPHVRDKASTHSIMLDVIIALIPATIFGFWNFGIHAIINTIICIATCVICEYAWQRLMHKKITINDMSATLTGLLLALNLPPEVPFWLPIIGGAFAIIVVKQVFGGLGQNFMNPALGARCFLLISFAGLMTDFSYTGFGGSFDATTSATPLAALKAGESVNLLSMFIGNEAGTVGETSALLLLIGGIYLIVRKVISWRIPVIYIVTLGVFVLLFGGHGFDLTYLAQELCGGGLMLGAFFMATDYVTSPITPNGQIVFALLLGILTGIFRLFGGSAEGVSYAIIFCNLLVPLIERFTTPTAFGKGGKKE